MKSFPAFIVFAAVMSLGGCAKSGPAPQSVLDQLKAHVENDGRESAREDIFSMPAGVTTPIKPGDQVRVTNVAYSSSMPPLSEEISGIPKGTVVHYYRTTSTRTKPDGSSKTERRLFYVYPDPSGEWHFFENKGAFCPDERQGLDNPINSNATL